MKRSRNITALNRFFFVVLTFALIAVGFFLGRFEHGFGVGSEWFSKSAPGGGAFLAALRTVLVIELFGVFMWSLYLLYRRPWIKRFWLFSLSPLPSLWYFIAQIIATRIDAPTTWGLIFLDASYALLLMSFNAMCGMFAYLLDDAPLDDYRG